MNNPFITPNAQNLSLFVARCALGAYFAIAGFSKISAGVGAFVAKNAGNVPPILPSYLGKTYLFLLPFVEVAAGVALILGVFPRVAAALMVLMLISFMLAVTGIGSPTGTTPFHPNVIFLGLAMVLVAVGPGSWSVGVTLFKGGRRG